MRHLEQFQTKPDYYQRYSSRLKAIVIVARADSSRKRLAQSAHRVNIDSWLSCPDANLLLRKRVQYEARKDNYAAAIKLLDRLIIREPENPSNFVNRGLMYSYLRRYDRAIVDYNRAIQIDSELDKAYGNRANLHAAQKNWTDAIADYDQAINLNPLNIRARLNQAITFRDIGDYDEALLCLDIALFFEPKSATLYSERGRTYHLHGHWNQAVADYTTACRLAEDPTLSDIRSSLSVLRRVTGWMSHLVSM